ncbi:serine/threonine-protein kinase [Saccharothrix isguenensis]
MTERDEVIAGRYRLVALVGRGAGGVVWRAHDERLGRAVAVKFLGAGGSADAVARTLREGRVAARLRHPHAVTVHDVVEHGGKPCLVMEYLPSRTLAELVDERGPLPEELVAGVGWQVASALAAAHAAGIVHRDVSTFNILLADDGTAKIADFGVARAIGEGTVTDARAIVGTPAFLAPEVAAGEDAVFASDVYSLGATLYAALEGHPPFGTTDNPYALLRRVSEAEVAPLRFPGPLGDVLMDVLRREPSERPTMAELHGLLGAVVEGRAVSGAVPDPEPVRDTMPLVMPRRTPWRRAALVAGALAAAAALVAGGVVVVDALRGGERGDRALPGQSSGTSTSAVAPSSAATTTTTTTTTTTAAPAPDVTSPAEPDPVTSSVDCDADFTITNSWPGGYQALVTVRNAAERALTEWVVTWPQPAGHVISNLWNGRFTAEGGSVRVVNADHNATLPVDGSTTFGFTANGPGTPRPDVTCSSGRG